MTVESRAQALDLWSQTRRNGLSDPEAEAKLYGFFQAFRPDGAELDQGLTDIVGGPEILLRLHDIYRATAPGWDSRDAYFVVRRVQAIAPAELKKRVREHLFAMKEIAHAMGHGELESLLQSDHSIEVSGGESPEASSDPDIWLHEVAADFMALLTPVESEALMLREALHGIACDYFLQYHILWPIYRSSTRLEEPFRAYFDLWKHGARCRLTGERVVVVQLNG